MTRTISLIIGIATVALAVAVPSAFGKGQPPQDAVVAPDWFERAALRATDNTISTPIVSERTPEPLWMQAARLRGEGLNGAYGLGEFATPYRDGHERNVVSQAVNAELIRSEALNRKYSLGEFSATAGYRDAHERAVPPTSQVVSSPTSSGSDVEWPQVGIGLGIALALGLGLILTLKATRTRPFAH